VLHGKSCIIAGTFSRHQQAGYKFGIHLSTSIADAWRLDKENGNMLWIDAFCKELDAIMIAFEVQYEEVKHIPGYKQIPGHIVWDVKMDFTHKACYVAGGHQTNPPKVLTCSSVVSRESVRIALLLAGLNDLEVWLMDIGNAYLIALTMEKCYIIAGDEFHQSSKGEFSRLSGPCMD